jgi:hypothetical protein
VRHQFVLRVDLRIAATCLSVKQAVGYAADPGRAVKGVAHLVVAPAFLILATGSESPSGIKTAPCILAAPPQDKKRHSQEKARAGYVAVRMDAARVPSAAPRAFDTYQEKEATQ